MASEESARDQQQLGQHAEQQHDHPEDQPQQQVTLDESREQFYVAHRACERFSQQLGAFVKRLQEAKATDGWLSEVRGVSLDVLCVYEAQA